jgi:F-type H+-transporting ATPase subunit b
MPQFNPEFFASQVFWLAVTFIVLYLLMWRVALPRIAEVIEERSERLADDLEKAEKIRKEADAVVEQYEAALTKARSEASAVLAEAGKEISEMASRRQAEFSAALARKTEEAEQRIAAAKEEAKAQVRDIALDVSRDITEKLVGTAPAQTSLTRAVNAALKETA